LDGNWAAIADRKIMLHDEVVWMEAPMAKQPLVPTYLDQLSSSSSAIAPEGPALD